MVKWISTGHPWVLNIAEGFINASISYSVIRGEAFIARVNGERLPEDFPDDDAAKKAVMVWIKEKISKAQGEIDEIHLRSFKK